MGLFTKKLQFAIDVAKAVPSLGMFKLSGWLYPQKLIKIELEGEMYELRYPFLSRPDVTSHLGLKPQKEKSLVGILENITGFEFLLPDYVSDSCIALYAGKKKIWSGAGEKKLTSEQKLNFKNYINAYLKLINLSKIRIGKDIIVEPDFNSKLTLKDGLVTFNLSNISQLKGVFSDKIIEIDDSFQGNLKRALEYVFNIPSNVCDKSEGLEKEDLEKITLIIPVYNALDATTRCLNSLVKIDDFSIYEVIIVDDFSDNSTAKYLDSFAENYNNIRYIRQPKNGGFIKSCTTGLENSNPKSDIILLNSDIVLSKQALSLLTKGAHSRDCIAAASCMSTSSPNCQLEVPAGYSLQEFADWIEKNHKPKYPTLITPEGQCLYIKRWAIQKFGFFDPIFEEGFGEESDLCMRFYCGGADTICVDNALIFHRKSASFGLERGEELKSKHWPIFSERWGTVHRLMYSEFLQQNHFGELRDRISKLTNQSLYPKDELSFPHKKPVFYNKTELKKEKLLKETQVVFLLPNTFLGGGTLSVQQHVNHMIERGVNARIISLWKPFNTQFHAQASILPVDVENIFNLDWDKQKVIATFWPTAYVLNELSKVNKNIDAYYYVQGYEPDFYTQEQKESVSQASASYHLGIKTVVKSDYLKNRLISEHKVEATKINPGILRTVFYPGQQDIELKKRITAYYRPSTPDRGAKKIENVVSRILEKHPDLDISFFGENNCRSTELGDSVRYLGILSQEQVAAQYRRSEIVLDFADFHGFGRVGIEGMCSGSVPVLTDSGGINEYAIDSINSFIANDTLDLVEKINILIENPKKRLEMRSSALKTAENFSEQQATQDWLKLLNLC